MKKILLLLLTVGMCMACFCCSSHKWQNAYYKRDALQLIRNNGVSVFYDCLSLRIIPNIKHLVLEQHIVEYSTHCGGVYILNPTWDYAINRYIVGQWRLYGDTLILYPTLYAYPTPGDTLSYSSLSNLTSLDTVTRHYKVGRNGLYDITNYMYYYKDIERVDDIPYLYEYAPDLQEPAYRIIRYYVGDK